MKKITTLASLSEAGITVTGHLSFANPGAFGNRQYEMTPSLVKRGFTCHT